MSCSSARFAAVSAACLAVLLLRGAAAPAWAAGDGPAGGPAVLFQIGDERITESSGLAVSARHDGVVYTLNDGGDRARFFAIGPDGRTRATFTLREVSNVDWEALAPGPGPSLWIGDIGDNGRSRQTVSLYRVDEPRTLRDASVRWTRYRLRYPDRPHDAEALLVHPATGRVYIATKDLLGGELYQAPERLRSDVVNELTRVGDAPPLVTDGVFAPGGQRFVLRGYQSAWFYPQPGQPETFSLRLPDTRQGESVAWRRDGAALLVGSEGSSSPVWLVPLPAEAGGVAGRAAAPAAPSPASPAPVPGRWGTSLAATVAAAAIGLAVAAGAGWLAVRWRARRRTRWR